ncbi:MAG: N-6 DNA methylase [Myxococcales bacterium]|nr:N-6 DNA methylase [Myxococcales bacterium]
MTSRAPRPPRCPGAARLAPLLRDPAAARPALAVLLAAHAGHAGLLAPPPRPNPDPHAPPNDPLAPHAPPQPNPPDDPLAPLHAALALAPHALFQLHPVLAELAPAEPLAPELQHELQRLARELPPRLELPDLGALFTAALDPAARHRQGAHFTREQAILRVLGPTIVSPWRHRLALLRSPADHAHARADLCSYTVLDPACGCGDLLHAALRALLAIEAELRQHAPHPAPPGPWFTLPQLHGIERDPLAAALARASLQLADQRARPHAPRLAPTILTADALLAPWPRPAGALAIVGNPPYLGVRKLRRELGDAAVARLHAAFPNNRAADYATHWFTRARHTLRPGERAGYVCTKSITQNASRAASLAPLLAAGDTITDAWRAHPWAGEAAVDVAIVNWICGPAPGPHQLDGRPVARISASLDDLDLASARTLTRNLGLCFMGVTPGNDGFILTPQQRDRILADDPASAAVIRPFLIGRDLSRDPQQRPTRHIIDLATRSLAEAKRFPGALHHLESAVRPARAHNPREAAMTHWWQFWRPAPQLRRALASCREVLALPCVAPHLLITRQPADLCFDHQVMVLTLADPYHLGVLQSRFHALWARARGSSHAARPRYTATSVFTSFPFPRHPDGRHAPRERPPGPHAERVAAAATALERLRRDLCRADNIGLTQLHNQLAAGERPSLRAALDQLERAVTDCYGFPAEIWRDDAASLRELLALNLRLAEREDSEPARASQRNDRGPLPAASHPT